MKSVFHWCQFKKNFVCNLTEESYKRYFYFPKQNKHIYVWQWIQVRPMCCYMRPGIVRHHEEPRTHYTMSDNGSKDFLLMSNGSQGAVA